MGKKNDPSPPPPLHMYTSLIVNWIIGQSEWFLVLGVCTWKRGCGMCMFLNLTKHFCWQNLKQVHFRLSFSFPLPSPLDLSRSLNVLFFPNKLLSLSLSLTHTHTHMQALSSHWHHQYVSAAHCEASSPSTSLLMTSSARLLITPPESTNTRLSSTD